MKRLAIVLLACILAVPAFGAEVLPFAPSVDSDAVAAQTADKLALYSWVTSLEGRDKAAPYQVQVPLTDLAALKSHVPTGGPLWIGVDAEMNLVVDPSKAAFGSTTFADGFQVWTGSLQSPGATGVRLFLDKVNLPKGSKVFVYDRFEQVFGPYGSQGEKSFWTNTVAGDELVLQVHVPVGLRGLAKASFEIAQATHMGDSYAFGVNPDKAFCPWNDSCIVNAECANAPAALQNAAAYLLFSTQGGTYLCSGGLLNNTSNDGTPYLLTANHCFSRQKVANSLEAYFQWTVSCNSSCGSQYFPPGSVPRTNGATLLASSSNSDFTLVELDQAAPSGSTFLGWTTTPVANSSGTNLYRVSHPSGSPQAYSEQEVNTSAGTCGTLPRGRFIYSDTTLADTEGGSSGSVVANGSNQVVGQLYGACGASPSTTCDGDDRTVDGAFAETYSSVAQWLDPGTGGPTCTVNGDSCSTDSDCCSGNCSNGPPSSRVCQ